MEEELPSGFYTTWAARHLRGGLQLVHLIGVGCGAIMGGILLSATGDVATIWWAGALMFCHMALAALLTLYADSYLRSALFYAAQLFSALLWGLPPLLFMGETPSGYLEIYTLLLIAGALVLQPPLSHTPLLCIGTVTLMLVPAAAGFVPFILRDPWSLELGLASFTLVTATALNIRTMRIYGVNYDNARKALMAGDARRKLAANQEKLVAAERRIEQVQQWDPVTGTMSQAGFFRHLPTWAGGNAVSLCLKLKGFKYLNTAFGHGVGDDVLREVASRLVALTNSSERVCRTGGGQFVVFIPDASGRLEQQLTSLFHRPFMTRQGNIGVSGYWGICGLSSDHHTLDAVEMAMNAAETAKHQGRSRPVRFEAADIGIERTRSSLQFEIGDALRRNEFRLVYQPQFRFSDGHVCGFEALVRWRSGIFGEVGPGDFIPVAEESGQIVELGAWVLDQAMREVGEAARGNGIDLSVNVALAQLEESDFTATLETLLARHDFPAEKLVLELTEGSLMNEPEVIHRKLGELRGRGIRIALDDFGTGYSSLSWLARLPIDHVKIDRSLIRDIAEDRLTHKLVTSVLDICHTMGLTSCIEGIETTDQLNALGQWRDELLLQGFLFARPQPLAQALETIRSRPRQLG